MNFVTLLSRDKIEYRNFNHLVVTPTGLEPVFSP